MFVLQFRMFLLFMVILLSSWTSAFDGDEVKYLPGLKYKINFKQYSGYLNASSEKYLHYWFVESQNSPSTDPVLLWLNGGPGCSSLDGFLSELGPFHINDDGVTLYENPYSWNKVANVIFLEAPAGVGYSYSDSKQYSTNDDIVAQDNYLAIHNFFKKYPQFKKNDFYITGESYGGIYIPTLSVKVLTESPDINFKGFAIGNGYLNKNLNGNSVVFFYYYHGLIGKSLWNNLKKYCCSGCESAEKCDFVNSTSENCKHYASEAMEIISDARLNVYNLYDKCVSSSSNAKNSRLLIDKRNLFRSFNFLNQSHNMITEGVPCINSSSIANWLNQKAVREVLHIPTFLPEWQICSDEVAEGYHRLYDTMSPQILKLVNSQTLRGLIYNGDVDMACNYLGDEWFVDSLNLKVLNSFKPWFFDNQCAGFVKYYANLTFLTVKGSGHMVPQDKPGPAFKMISTFLNNEPF